MVGVDPPHLHWRRCVGVKVLVRGLASRSLGKVASPGEVLVEQVEWAGPRPRTTARSVMVAPLWIGSGSHHLQVLPSTTTIGIFGSGPWAWSSRKEVLWPDAVAVWRSALDWGRRDDGVADARWRQGHVPGAWGRWQPGSVTAACICVVVEGRRRRWSLAAGVASAEGT